MAAKKQYKLELFPLLRNISTKNVGYYDTLSEDSIKEFQPLVIMRWLTGNNDGSGVAAHHIFFLNEVVNPYVFTLGQKHKKLMYDLMTISCTGKDARYTFNKSKRKSGGTMPLTIAVIQESFGYSNKDAQEAIPLLDDDAIIDMAEQLGRQTGEIKELKKELKAKRPK
jgi:hypothetical protein